MDLLQIKISDVSAHNVLFYLSFQVQTKKIEVQCISIPFSTLPIKKINKRLKKKEKIVTNCCVK